MRITGVKIAYYFICHTKLWLFSHNITLEKENDNSIDFIRKGDTIVLHEIKKTKSMEAAHRWQMLYYLYYLKSKGVSATGEINYPLVSRKEEIALLEKDELDMENVINDIRKIAMGRMPQPKRTKICQKCAYFEFCFGDEV